MQITFIDGHELNRVDATPGSVCGKNIALLLGMGLVKQDWYPTGASEWAAPDLSGIDLNKIAQMCYECGYGLRVTFEA